MGDWYVNQDGIVTGPLSEATIIDGLKRGARKDVSVNQVGQPNWVPLLSVAAFREATLPRRGSTWKWVAGALAVLFAIGTFAKKPQKHAIASAAPSESSSITSAPIERVDVSTDVEAALREGFCLDGKCTTWMRPIERINATKSSGGTSVSIHTTLYPKAENHKPASSLCHAIFDTYKGVSSVFVFASDGSTLVRTDIFEGKRCAPVAIK